MTITTSAPPVHLGSVVPDPIGRPELVGRLGTLCGAVGFIDDHAPTCEPCKAIQREHLRSHRHQSIEAHTFDTPAGRGLCRHCTCGARQHQLPLSVPPGPWVDGLPCPPMSH